MAPRFVAIGLDVGGRMEPGAKGRGVAGQRSYEKLAWGRLLASTVDGYNPYFVGGPPSCQPGDLTIPDTHPP